MLADLQAWPVSDGRRQSLYLELKMTFVNRALSGPNNTHSPESCFTEALSDRRYENLDCRHDVQDRTFWCFFDVHGRPAFTEALLMDIHDVQEHIASLAMTRRTSQPAPVGWVVIGSRTPDVFSLGGDLTVFASKIQNGDREGLRQYAYSCVEIAHRNATGYGGSAISIGLAQGEALGGGFESLLSCDVLIAERRARFGFPEVLMNLFPGMGAHCFLKRRAGPAAAVRMILSGEVFTAEELHKAGIVDVLAENGKGEEAAQSYILRHQSRHRCHSSTYEAARRISPVSLASLKEVCDIWVDTAMEMTAPELRRMAHLVSAQDRSRRRQASTPAAAA